MAKEKFTNIVLKYACGNLFPGEVMWTTEETAKRFIKEGWATEYKEPKKETSKNTTQKKD